MSVRTTVLFAVFTAAGCAAMMRSMEVKPRTAENPLVSGQALEASKKANVGVVSEQDCDQWPFEDTLSVRVTEAEICISARKHKDVESSWSGEPTSNSSENFSVANEAGEGGYITAKKVRSSKVSKCFNKGYNQEVKIWAFDYEGCAPNNGTVTASTKSLNVEGEAWAFPTAQAASAGAPAPAGS
jgi:hypothetical protein